MSSQIRLVFLGGQDEADKQMIAVEIDGDIFVVEAGISYPDRTKHGIDYIIPKYDYLLLNKDRVRAYILTSGNDQAIGAVPFMIDKIPAPIVCSDITRIFLYTFCEHNGINPSSYQFKLVDPSDDIEIAGHQIRLFSLTSNNARSFGVSFTTDQGNIIITNNFVIDNNSTNGFLTDVSKMGAIANQPTLALLCDASFAEREGYSNPSYKFVPRMKNEILDASGRVFIALETPDVYNILETLKLCIKEGKKIVFYDENTFDLISRLERCKLIDVPQNSILPVENINRTRAQDIVVIMTGFGSRLLDKIVLLASHQNDNKIIVLNETDTFIVGCHAKNDLETSFAEAIDEIYRANAKVITFKKNEFITIHPSKEDIKSFISIFKPKYFFPVKAYLVSLLAAAKLAVEMGVGLNHNNVYILDNGLVVKGENGLCSISSEKVLTGNVMVDGNYISQFSESLIQERQQFSDDGVVILGAMISKSKHQIVGGPDIQSRGLVYAKDSESLLRDIERLFVMCIDQELAKENPSIKAMEENAKDVIFKQIRRVIMKTPLIICFIKEVD